jgi:flagellar biosynthesis/type III secretory pathway protein FliH
MITCEAQPFSFPKRQQFRSSPGLRQPTPAADDRAIKDAIDRGYAEGLERGRRAAELEAKNTIEAARREGFESGRTEAITRLEQAAAALRDALGQLKHHSHEMLCQAESFCVDLALAIVSRLIESDAGRAEFVSRVVSKALEELAPEPPRTIYISPADRALVADEFEGLPLKDDPTLAPGHARVETGRLLVEDGIERAFEQIKSAVLEVKEQRARGSELG